MSRLSHQGLVAYEARLTPRRRQLVEAVALLRLVSGGQLRRRFYEPGASAARLARLDLAALAEAAVLHRLQQQVGGVRAGSSGFVYALGPVGRRLVDLWSGEGIAPGRSRYEPTIGFVAHALAVSELWVALHDYLTGRWTREPTASLQFAVEQQAWRTFPGARGVLQTLKPDAELLVRRPEFDDHWWIEVDRGTERRAVIRRKLDAYLAYFATGIEQRRSGVFPLTAWLTTTDSRAAVLEELVAELPIAARRLFRVGLLAAGPPLLMTPERSDQ